MALGQLVVRLGLDAVDFTQGMSRSEAEAQRFAAKLDAPEAQPRARLHPRRTSAVRGCLRC